MKNKTLEIESLLKSTRTLVRHHREITRIKGESFNVFSILEMERAENKTHSNFIGELLDPKGNHLMGGVFLTLFLKTIKEAETTGEEEKKESEDFDSTSTSVHLEYSVGPVDLDNAKGGRIDILLMDGQGRTISIENKIDAIDQPKQLLRYSNFNKNRNKVYYLTKFRRDPGPEVRGQLEEGTDYWNITYKVTMVAWLNECLKEAADKPLIRESIKQYIVLIRKLTGTMNKEEETQLIKLVSGNLESARFIVDNYESAKTSICESFRNDVFSSLKKEIGEEFELEKCDKITTRHPKIWISHKEFEKAKVYFGIESFSGGGQRKVLFIGTFIYEDDGLKYLTKNNGEKPNKYWCDQQDMPEIEGVRFSLEDAEFLQLIYSNQKARQKAIEAVVIKTKDYISQYGAQVKDYLKEPSA